MKGRMIPYVGKYKDPTGDILHIIKSRKINDQYNVVYYWTRADGRLLNGFTTEGTSTRWWWSDESYLKRIDSFKDYLRLCE